MDYERFDSKDKPHQFTFESWEIEVVQAAYTEDDINIQRKGNSNSETSLHNKIIGFTGIDEKLILFPRSETEIAEVLEKFDERTDEEAREIAELPTVKFRNRDAFRRRELGKWAGDLATRIRKETDPDISLSDLSDKILRQIEEYPGTPEQS